MKPCIPHSEPTRYVKIPGSGDDAKQKFISQMMNLSDNHNKRREIDIIPRDRDESVAANAVKVTLFSYPRGWG